MFDIITLAKTFVHTNVAGALIEDLTTDPTICSYYDYGKADNTQNTNGYIVFHDEEETQPDDFGPTRHENYFIRGFILYNSLTLLTSATIMAIKAELRRIFNVNNASTNTYLVKFVVPTRYNGNPENGRIDFNLKVSKIGVSAIA